MQDVTRITALSMKIHKIQKEKLKENMHKQHLKAVFTLLKFEMGSHQPVTVLDCN